MQNRPAKLISLAFCTVIFTTAILTDNPAVETAQAFPTGPDPGRTAAPGELSCATSECHGTSINTGAGKFIIVAPQQYEPGQTYQITIRHETTDTTRARWGFQLTALNETNNRAGTLQNTSGFTSIVSDAGPSRLRQYIQHNITGTFRGQTVQASWTFNWIAPDEDVGRITFHAAGNQADNDNTSTGDQIYTAKATISSAAAMPMPATLEILGAEINGKKLIVTGDGFAAGAQLFVIGRVRVYPAITHCNLYDIDYYSRASGCGRHPYDLYAGGYRLGIDENSYKYGYAKSRSWIARTE